MNQGNSSEQQLVRGLTLSHTVALAIGAVIGNGIFLKSAVMAQSVGSPGWVLAAWVVAGAVSLAGALTYGELGALLPRVGGEYVYLRRSYGDALAFLYGWTGFVVTSTGSIAAIAASFATFSASLLPMNQVWFNHAYRVFGQTIHWQFGTQQIVAIVAILFFSGVNCAGVAFAGWLQTLMTILKLAGIALIVAGAFFFSRRATFAYFASPAGAHGWPGLTAFGTAMLAALWAYNGWNQVPMVASEIQQPARNLPRALVIGMVIVVVAYLLTNLSYFFALPYGEIANANSTAHRLALPVATKAAQTFLGSFGVPLVSVIFVISTLGTLNACVLTFARVPYAMASDGLFFDCFRHVNASARVPVVAIVLQAVWSSLLTLSGTYDQLTDYAIFAMWIFYALTTSSVFILRKKMADERRWYRTPGYPFVPAAFVVMALWLVWNTVHTRPLESTCGLVVIALGIPFYAYFRRKGRRDAKKNTEHHEISEPSIDALRMGLVDDQP